MHAPGEGAEPELQAPRVPVGREPREGAVAARCALGRVDDWGCRKPASCRARWRFGQNDGKLAIYVHARTMDIQAELKRATAQSGHDSLLYEENEGCSWLSRHSPPPSTHYTAQVHPEQ